MQCSGGVLEASAWRLLSKQSAASPSKLQPSAFSSTASHDNGLAVHGLGDALLCFACCCWLRRLWVARRAFFEQVSGVRKSSSATVPPPPPPQSSWLAIFNTACLQGNCGARLTYTQCAACGGSSSGNFDRSLGFSRRLSRKRRHRGVSAQAHGLRREIAAVACRKMGSEEDASTSM